MFVFVRPLSVVAVLALSASGAVAGGPKSAVDEEAVNARIQPVARVELAPAGAGAAGSRTGEQMFQSACTGCHTAGTLSAPKIGSNGDWAPRIGKGLSGLLATATNGLRSMPAKGGVADATEAELARAIVYMVNKSGGSLKEPQ